MARLEEITKDALVRGILPSANVTVIDAKWHGSDVLQVTYRAANGSLGDELLYRDCEPTLELVTASRPWSFNGDGEMLRLVSEALRIRLAYLFDPVLAVHTSLVEPYPHQISAVYEEMLTRQPLRFLLADDPGAGKTFMAGLLIKEMIVRGDLQRCMIVAPGSLVEQWQDEMHEKFQIPFEVMTNDNFEAARTGNWFGEHDLVVCRLDKLSRNEGVQEKLSAADDYDLIIVDEAHKMSASLFGDEVKRTKRYQLGQMISRNTRHFLLMSATPHNGKEEDFQLFMALLDGDRFEGRMRQGVRVVDAGDMMRRMVKEQLYKFDETKLFPERIAHTARYRLNDAGNRLACHDRLRGVGPPSIAANGQLARASSGIDGATGRLRCGGPGRQIRNYSGFGHEPFGYRANFPGIRSEQPNWSRSQRPDFPCGGPVMTVSRSFRSTTMRSSTFLSFCRIRSGGAPSASETARQRDSERE